MAPPEVSYLRSLAAVRQRSQAVFDLILAGKADHWDWHEDRLAVVVDFCAGLLTRDFGTDYASIPPHCRRNHFTTPKADRIAALLADPAFPTDPLGRTKSLIDLYLVSVLLDAGAGNAWTYVEHTDGRETWRGGRSEGLAVASWHMFVDGLFSSTPGDKLRVDATALQALTPQLLGEHLQVSEGNPMSGLEGRAGLLRQLGDALAARRDICAHGRPGDILSYLLPQLENSNGTPVLPLSLFWDTLFDLLAPIWPARTTLPSHPHEILGDVWPCPSLRRSLQNPQEGDDLVPFHKLTQWLSYSLLEPIESVAGWRIERGAGQTGLPEYRNGGLLVDHGLLSVRDLPESAYPNGRGAPPVLPPPHPAVVEWRAATVIALDKIHAGVCERLGVSTDTLQLAQVLEASTWKGGREIAKTLRPETGGPPIEIVSDGTVF